MEYDPSYDCECINESVFSGKRCWGFNNWNDFNTLLKPQHLLHLKHTELQVDDHKLRIYSHTVSFKFTIE